MILTRGMHADIYNLNAMAFEHNHVYLLLKYIISYIT